MPGRTSNRLDRINDQVKQELALLIREELRDPRLGMVSVIDARVSRDLAHAEVYVTVLGAEAKESTAALNHASGYLRNLLAKRLNLRSTPKLRFVYDASVEHGRKLSALIDHAVALDSARADEADTSSEDSASSSAGPQDDESAS
ncbi:MAG TPA: 30S ribosome-binding factor RbfA [Hyphomicrobiales bacterium]|nr:30S ribosome-binding factor RbfA [Hyphomicrobiales bacterium]